MPITLKCADPERLLADIKAAMKAGDDEPADVRTWEVNDKGEFHYKVAQYAGLAWFKANASSKDGMITWTLGFMKNDPPDDEIRGVYFGRFVQMLVSHFRRRYSSITVE